MASTVTELLRRRFGGKKDILPSGYTELTWLTNNGTLMAGSYFDTGISRSDSTSQLIDIETKIRFNDSTPNGYMGTDNGCFFGRTNNKWTNAATSATSFAIEVGRAYNVRMYRNDITNQTLYVDDVPILTNQRTLSGTKKVYMFNIDSYNVGSYQLVCSLGRTKIYKARELVRDFVPCISPNDIYGMYDLIEGTFYGSQTINPFTGE